MNNMLRSDFLKNTPFKIKNNGPETISTAIVRRMRKARSIDLTFSPIDLLN